MAIGGLAGATALTLPVPPIAYLPFDDSVPRPAGWLLRRGPLGRAFVKVMSGAPNQCPRSAADVEPAIRGGHRSSSYGSALPAGARRAHPLGQGIRGAL